MRIEVLLNPHKLRGVDQIRRDWPLKRIYQILIILLVIFTLTACTREVGDQSQASTGDSSDEQGSVKEESASDTGIQTNTPEDEQSLDDNGDPTEDPSTNTDTTPGSVNDLGLSSDQIMQLELGLRTLGYAETGIVDGVLDQQTVLAVRHLQWINGLAITGEVDSSLLQKINSGELIGFSFPPPFPAQALSQFTTGQMDDGFLKGRLVDLDYLDSRDPAFDPFDFDPQTAAAVNAFQKNNTLTADGIVDYEVWNAIFKLTAVNAAGVQAFQEPEAGDWSTTFYPIMDNPIDLAFDGQNIWVLHSEGEDAFSNLLLRINPESGLLDQMPPVMLGDPESQDNRIAEMLFDGSKLWFLLPQSFNPPQLINFIPDNGEKFLQFEYMDCQSGGCLPAESLGFDGEMIWATGGNQVWAINKGTGQRYLTYEVGWLTTGQMVYDGECLWMANETGIEAFHPEGDYLCRGSEDSYALPPGPVVFDGQRIWTADKDLGVVYWLDLDSGKISAPVVVGDEPSALVFDGETLWIANAGEDTIVGIDVETQVLGPVLHTGSRPVALLFDGSRLWVANAGDKTLQLFDIEK